MVNNKQIRNVRTFGADFSQTTTPFSVYAATRQSVDYVVNLWDCLETLSDIDEALMVLQLASEDDTVTLRLNMDGGSHSVGDALIQAMQSCKCEVHVIASGRIASYGTFILLSADSFEISEFATIMCHAASFGSFGKQGAVKEHVMFEHDQCVKMIKHYYKYFLTEAEITRLLEEGHDLWLTAEQFIERFQQRNKLLAAEQDTCDCEECNGCDDDEPLTEEEEEELHKALEGLKHKIKDKTRCKPLP